MTIISTKVTIETNFLVVNEDGEVTSVHPQSLEVDLTADGLLQAFNDLMEAKYNLELSEGELKMLVRTGNILSLGSIQSDKLTTTRYIASSSIVITESGTSRTLSATDNGSVIMCTSGSATTITVPTGLDVGFNITLIQAGAGQITFSASSTTINNRQSHTKTAGQWAVTSLFQRTTNNFVLAGDTAA